MTDGNEWDMEIRRTEVENVTLGRPANDCVIMFCRMTKNKQNVNKNNVEYTGWLKIKYPTGEYAISLSLQSVV